MAKRTDKPGMAIAQSSNETFPLTSSKRDELVEKYRKEGYDVKNENGVIMFYGEVSFDKIKSMLKVDGYDSSFGVTKKKS